MNGDGTGLVRLIKFAGAHSPRWSPGGERIVFEGGRHIYVIKSDATELIQLTNSPEGDFMPMWSPDGQKIAFVRAPAGFVERKSYVYVMNADGTGQSRLSPDGVRDDGPVWSPDGKKIAFVSASQVYVMNVDGSGRQRLSPDPAAIDNSPSWSPDGRQIAFVSADSEHMKLLVMNADGASPKDLNSPFFITDKITRSDIGDHFATRFSCPYIANPQWAPQGNRLAFWCGFGYPSMTSLGGLFYEVDRLSGFIMVRPLDQERADALEWADSDFDPPRLRWSPDGSRIVYTGAAVLSIVDTSGNVLFGPFYVGLIDAPDWTL